MTSPVSSSTVASPSTTVSVSSHVNCQVNRPGVQRQTPRSNRASSERENTMPLASGAPSRTRSAGSGHGSSSASAAVTAIAASSCVLTVMSDSSGRSVVVGSGRVGS